MNNLLFTLQSKTTSIKRNKKNGTDKEDSTYNILPLLHRPMRRTHRGTVLT